LPEIILQDWATLLPLMLRALTPLVDFHQRLQQIRSGSDEAGVGLTFTVPRLDLGNK
jgi:hypothetical protein